MGLVDVISSLVEKTPGWLWFVILLGPVIAMLYYHLSLGVRRAAEWERTAMVLGYVHHDEDNRLANTFKSLASFSDVDGFQTRSLDVLSKDANGTHIYLLDHASGTPRKLRTTCVIRTGELQVPRFRLLPARKNLRLLKGQVHFQEDPEFSKRFVLTADDPEAIKRLFDPAIRHQFLEIYGRCRAIEKANTDWFSRLMLMLSNAVGCLEIEAACDTLCIHLSLIINPRGAPEFLAGTEETLRILKSRLSEVST